MSRQARQRRKRRNRSGPSRIVFIGLGGVAGAIVLGVVVAVGYVLSVAQSAPSLDSLTPKLAGASSQVFAANGTRLGFIQSDVLRSPITSGQIPRMLREATVAIEDQRFYQNNGVDLTGIFRSAVKDALHGQTLQGASTITMQLMRNIYLGSDTHSFKQKIEEAKL
ncbi:MAG: biosynthetic peptidoglycan transglycosylase, partial [Solirubrobacteraceae bacterium]